MKNLLLSTAFLLFSFSAFTQLYVKPNGIQDSYIYVKDQILFVEQGLNLTVNPTSGSEASIYLRNNAQLIQGTSNTLNDGTGEISVLQNTPDSDAWDYTYWASPVGNPRPAAPAPGNRYFGLARVNNYQTERSSTVSLTTPALNGIITPMTISTRWLYMKPDGLEAESDYERFGAGNSVPTGMGFTMKGLGTTNHDQVYDFRGRANNGDISFPIFADEYTLSGNPYPSALDLNLVFYDPANAAIKQFKYWDEDHSINSHQYADNRGGYGTYVPGPTDPTGTTDNGFYTAAIFKTNWSGGSSSGNFGPGAIYARRFAPIGQGVLFEGLVDGTVTIKNSHRRYFKEGASTGTFRRPGSRNIVTDDESPFDEVDNRIPQIRINVKFSDSHIRQLVLALYAHSTDTFDRGLDGEHPMDAQRAEAYFPVADDDGANLKPYVIQTVPFEFRKKIPIIFELDEPFSVEVEAIEEVNLPTEAAYLWDNSTNAFHKITGGQAANLILQAGEYNNRFFIVFRNSSSTIPDTTNDGGIVAIGDRSLPDTIKASVDVFQNNNIAQLEINNPEGYNIKAAYVFDMNGKMLIQQQDIGSQTNFSFSTANLSDAVYIVKLITIDNITIDYKVSVYNNR